MPRKGPARRLPVPPDPVYGDVLLQRFINRVMTRGKKSIAERIVYGALNDVEQKTGKPGIDVFQQAIRNVMPVVEVKPRRVGGATYQVPIEIPPALRVALAFRWIIEFARKRGEKTMAERLAGEILDCANNQGSTIKRREDTHKMAEANKAFAHFRY